MAESKFKLMYIPISAIDVSKDNVRTVNIEVGLEELTESIREIGVQQPVVVIKKGDRYELIIGQRRLLAAKKAELSQIPAIVRTVDNQLESLIASFSENIHRMDLDYRDKMQVAERLLAQLGSPKKVANAIGVSEQTVRNYLGYSIVPDQMKKMVEEKRINAQTAIRIARSIPDERKAVQIAEKVQEIPTSRGRELIISLGKEKPDASVEDLTRIAHTASLRKITIDLTPNVSLALQKACNVYKADAVEITTEALLTWLKERGFLL